MLKQIMELARLLWSLGQETQENKQAIKELREELNRRDERLRELTQIVQQLAFELQRLKENEAHEREKWALRTENALLRLERRLPLSPPDENPK
jgi:archaellum component FlaC